MLYSNGISLIFMHIRTLSAASISLASLLTVSLASAADAGAEIQSCSRLEGQEKTTCAWENRKAYLEYAKDHPASSAPSTNTVQLPSCARLGKGIERTKCLVENQKALKAMLIGGTAASSAPSAEVTSSAASSKSAKPCVGLRGKQQAQCKRDLRKSR